MRVIDDRFQDPPSDIDQFEPDMTSVFLYIEFDLKFVLKRIWISGKGQ